MGSDSPLAPSTAKPNARSWIALLLVLGLTVLTFHGTFSHQFVEWDDHAFLFHNPALTLPTLQSLAEFWTRSFRSLYQPLPCTVWWVIAKCELMISGNRALTPAPFHAANLIAHCLATLAIFGLLRLLVGNDLAAIGGATIFALHPIQAESVNWASALSTPLSGALGFGALWLYALHAKSTKTANTNSAEQHRFVSMTFLIATILYALALLSRPAIIMLPVMAAAMDRGLIGRGYRKIFLSLLPWIILAVPIAVIAAHVQPATYVQNVPILRRPQIALDALTFYLRQIIWPAGFAIDYGRTPQVVLASPAAAWTWIIPAALGLFAWRARRKMPWLGIAAIVMVAGVLPVLGFVKFEFQEYSTVADHYFYLSMLGTALIAAFVIRCLKFQIGIIAIVAIAIVLAVRSSRESSWWRDTDSLVGHDLKINPQSVFGHNSLAYRAAAAGQDEEALKQDLIVLQIHPDDSAANANLANLLLRHGQANQAIPHFQIAMELLPHDAQVRTNLGIALAQVGRLEEAQEQLQVAVDLEPHSAEKHANLARVDLELGKLNHAESEYQAALAIDPDLQTAQRGLSLIDQLRHPPASAPKP
jgi:Tfp pilus assembly protein PilF